MTTIFTKSFWGATLERAIKTFAQTAAGAAIVINFTDLDATGNSLIAALSIATSATVLSVLTSIGTGVATDGSPGLVEVPTAEVNKKIDQALIEEQDRQARLKENT